MRSHDAVIRVYDEAATWSRRTSKLVSSGSSERCGRDASHQKQACAIMFGRWTK
jgi:hypothetical protein